MKVYFRSTDTGEIIGTDYYQSLPRLDECVNLPVEGEPFVYYTVVQIRYLNAMDVEIWVDETDERDLARIFDNSSVEGLAKDLGFDEEMLNIRKSYGGTSSYSGGGSYGTTYKKPLKAEAERSHL